ncbi:MAG TPA: hypothetical protein VF498_17550 [Anaerolineales bacterium]
MHQQAITFQTRLKPLLLSVSWALLAAEGLDMLSTFVGTTLFPQMWETNPLPAQLGGWIPTILAKVVATALVILILERIEKWPKQVWIIPWVALLPAAWNVINMFAELIARA